MGSLCGSQTDTLVHFHIADTMATRAAAAASLLRRSVVGNRAVSRRNAYYCTLPSWRSSSSSSVPHQRPSLFHRRSIAIGTDMVSSVIGLQKARPWYTCNDAGSNQASDHQVLLSDLFAAGRTVVVFGVPAPFTGVCTHEHYPAYKAMAAQLLTKCDEIVCLAVSDPYAMHAWSVALDNDNDPHSDTTTPPITFLTDDVSNPIFTKAYGVSKLYDSCSLGLRSERFSMIVVDGVVQAFRTVTDPSTDALSVWADLQELESHEKESMILGLLTTSKSMLGEFDSDPMPLSGRVAIRVAGSVWPL
jgi:glutaredoxin/glutathione-dependent peroxiredoxin